MPKISCLNLLSAKYLFFYFINLRGGYKMKKSPVVKFSDQSLDTKNINDLLIKSINPWAASALLHHHVQGDLACIKPGIFSNPLWTQQTLHELNLAKKKTIFCFFQPIWQFLGLFEMLYKKRPISAALWYNNHNIIVIPQDIAIGVYHDKKCSVDWKMSTVENDLGSAHFTGPCHCHSAEFSLQGPTESHWR